MLLVRHFDVLDPLLHVRGERQFGGVTELFQGELDIVRGEGSAVVPRYAWANRDVHAHKVVGYLVALGQPGNLFAVIVIVIVEELETVLLSGPRIRPSPPSE